MRFGKPLAQTLDAIRKSLSDLSEIDLGYPTGDNFVREAIKSELMNAPGSLDPGLQMLAELYACCDGLAAPDVHVGYFIESSSVAAAAAKDPAVSQIAGLSSKVLSFGSTGGGALFVVDCHAGSVILLPPGSVQGGSYKDARSARVVANSVPTFFERLLADVTAFVDDNSDHTFIC